MFCAALLAYWAFAGLHPVPTNWVPSRMQAVVLDFSYLWQVGIFFAINICFDILQNTC